MLERLVAFNTESRRSNLDIIAFIADWLAGHGVACARFPNAAGDKAALFATIGPAQDGGVLLSGHTDVVPVAGQAWSSDPWRLRVEHGRAYGRGAVDMKGFLAIALALVPEMRAAPLKRPLHLLFSYDEEITCLGVTDAIARMGVDLPRPAAAIVGEPTDMEVVSAHKSVVSLTTRVTGREGHSSRPAAGASAIHAAARLIGWLDDRQRLLAAEGDPSGLFDPPCSTLQAGMITGGTARNIIARECRFLWEFRGLPGHSHETVMQELAAFAERDVLPPMRRAAPEARVETTCDVAVPHLAPRPGSEAEQLALRLAGRNRTGAVSFATEAGHFQNAGIATVVCGPGSIAQAHQADEFITLAALDEGAAFIRRLVAALSA
ncbi:acetylornithine deacetylase [Camelimonas abortus]|uniref:Acetylornithine deacetylase n=1 Tax=Camelimonas abortus TaxID=1017184 RepID=A0ABV7LDI7_9HYPH